MVVTCLFVAVLLLIGILLRVWIPVFRSLHIPGSVIAGFVGLAVVQGVIRVAPDGVAASVDSVVTPLKQWPSFLIAVIFAAMLLQSGSGKNNSGKPHAISARRVGRQGLMVWIIVLGEAAVGLLVTGLIVQRFFDVPDAFGMLIETGFAGGHATAGAMGDVFDHPRVNFASGRDLGMLMATCGLVYGLVSGIFWVNVGLRRGWARRAGAIRRPDQSDLPRSAEQDHATSQSGGRRGSGVDPLLLQLVWIGIAMGIGVLIHAGVSRVGHALSPTQIREAVEAESPPLTKAGDVGPFEENNLESQAKATAADSQLRKRFSWANLLDGFPLFIFTLAGGWVVRSVVVRVGAEAWIDSNSITSLSGSAMDLLVVAAITTLNVSAVFDLALPFLVLFVAGCLWTTVCLVVISRRILPPDHWFELAMINYGMSTGTTATGFILLRLIDPKLESSAAEDYALAAPLSAPFIGGGLITISLPLVVLGHVSIWIPTAGLGGAIIALVAFGCLTRRGATLPRDSVVP